MNRLKHKVKRQESIENELKKGEETAKPRVGRPRKFMKKSTELREFFKSNKENNQLKCFKKNVGKKDISVISNLLNSLNIKKDFSFEMNFVKSDTITEKETKKLFRNLIKNFRNELYHHKINGNYYRYLKGVINDIFRNSLKLFVDENCEKEKVIGNCFLLFNNFFDELISKEIKLKDNPIIEKEFYIKTEEIFDVSSMSTINNIDNNKYEIKLNDIFKIMEPIGGQKPEIKANKLNEV